MANRKFKLRSASAASAQSEARSGTPIYDESQGAPPKGPYRARIKNITGGDVASGPNEGESKFRMVVEIEEPEGTRKAKYNGYAIWYHMTIVDSNAGNVNQFLDVLTDGKPKSTKDKVRTAFWQGNIMIGDKDLITKIGTFPIPEGGVPCGVNATTKPAQGGYAAGLQVGDLMPISRVPESGPADEEEPDEDEDEEDEEEEPEDESEEDDEIAEREEELGEMTLAQLRSAAKKLDIDTAGLKKAGLIEAIIEAEFPEDEEVEDDDDEEDEEEPDEDEDEEDEEEEPEEDDLREELSELSLSALKKRAKEEGFKLADYKGLDSDGIIDLIVGEDEEPEDEEDEEDEEPEEEPEPVKKATRRPAAKKSAATAKAPARRGKRSGGDRPPF